MLTWRKVIMGQRGPRLPKWRMNSRPVWRPLGTGRRVLRTKIHQSQPEHVNAKDGQTITFYRAKFWQNRPAPVCATSGKPSTWLPLGRLVEQASLCSLWIWSFWMHFITLSKIRIHMTNFVWTQLRVKCFVCNAPLHRPRQYKYLGYFWISFNSDNTILRYHTKYVIY